MKKTHGIDQFSIALVWLAIILMIFEYLFKAKILSFLSLGTFVFAVYRTISTNELKRNSENYIFKLKILNPITTRIGKIKRRIFGDEKYKYLKCKYCSQELRVPKGKGKIIVKCPKCKKKQKIKS